jgi:hypothetical protein
LLGRVEGLPGWYALRSEATTYPIDPILKATLVLGAQRAMMIVEGGLLVIVWVLNRTSQRRLVETDRRASSTTPNRVPSEGRGDAVPLRRRVKSHSQLKFFLI